MTETEGLTQYDVSDRIIREYGSINGRTKQDMKNRHQYLLAVIELAQNKYPHLHFLDAFCKYEKISKDELIDLMNYNSAVIATF